MAKIVFIAAIAHSTFYANPTWGAEALPRDVAGNVISDRWIQPSESFFMNPGAWVHTYQNYCHQIPHGPSIEVELPNPPAPETASETASDEAEKQEPGQPAEPAQPEAGATNSDAQPEADHQAEAPKPPAPKKKKAAAPKAEAAAPTPEADQAAPAPDQADQAAPKE